MALAKRKQRMINIGERIRGIRKRRGYTQVELAKRASLTQGQVSKYERYAEAPAEALLKIAEALDTSIEYLVGRTDDPEPPVKLTPRMRKLLVAVDALDHEPTLDDLIAIWLDNLPEETDLGNAR